MSEQKKQNLPKKPPNNYLKYSAMGLQMGAIITIWVFGGIKLDKLLQMQFPIFTLSLTLLSVFAAIYYFIKDVLKNSGK